MRTVLNKKKEDIENKLQQIRAKMNISPLDPASRLMFVINDQRDLKKFIKLTVPIYHMDSKPTE
jgi:hypothetical protein